MAQRDQWQISGDAAELYERYLVPAMFRPWAADLVALARLKEGDRVLDVACGTGIVARHAAPRVGPSGRVVGLDVNDQTYRAILSDLTDDLGPYLSGDGLIFPMGTHVATARR